MKIRIKENQLRIRIQPDEQNQLLGGQSIETNVNLSNNFLNFQLAINASSPSVATFHAGQCLISIKRSDADSWRKNPKERITFTQNNQQGKPTQIVVELDLMTDKMD